MSLSRDFSKIRKLVRNRRFLKQTRRDDPHGFVRFFKGWNTGADQWPINVEFNDERQIFRVSDEGAGSVIHVSRPARVSLYAAGIEARLAFLWKEYLTHHVPVSPGDVVLDIGANVGEFSIEALGRGARVISIEPDPTEFRSLKANAHQGTPLNIALWNERKTMTFYSKNATGDSSLIEMSDYSEKIDVSAMTLDEVTEEYVKGKEIQLIKLEAEGAEPEIIQGALATLARTRYIAVDAGPERGFEQENTVVEVLDALGSLGFELIRFGNHRYVMLFERKPD